MFILFDPKYSEDCLKDHCRVHPHLGQIEKSKDCCYRAKVTAIPTDIILVFLKKIS